MQEADTCMYLMMTINMYLTNFIPDFSQDNFTRPSEAYGISYLVTYI